MFVKSSASGFEEPVEVAGEVALEAAGGFTVALSFLDSTLDVGVRRQPRGPCFLKRALRLLIALELVVAAHAVDLAGVEELGVRTARLHAGVRALAEPLRTDRPVGADVERVAASIDQLVAG